MGGTYSMVRQNHAHIWFGHNSFKNDQFWLKIGGIERSRHGESIRRTPDVIYHRDAGLFCAYIAKKRLAPGCASSIMLIIFRDHRANRSICVLLSVARSDGSGPP